MAPMAETRKAGKTYDGFTDEERGAMKERAKELKAAARRGKGADDAAAQLAKIAELPDADRVMAERIDAVIKASAPELSPKLWYGMPGYARNGKIVCFFQPAHKFKSRYATLGFNDVASLDDGSMWATAFAVTEVTAEVEDRIRELVRKAVS